MALCFPQERVLAAEFQRNVSGVADKERFGAFIAKHSIGGVSVLDPLGKAARIDGSKVLHLSGGSRVEGCIVGHCLPRYVVRTRPSVARGRRGSGQARCKV